MTAPLVTATDESLDAPRPARRDHETLLEVGLASLVALVLIWVPFHLGGYDAPFGSFLAWFAATAAIYGIVMRQRHGVLVAKDRLATFFVLSGLGVALIPLGLVLYYTARQGLPVVLQHFPSFLVHDRRDFGPNDPVSRAGMAHAIVGTLEQVGIAALVTIPVGVLAATYLNEIGGRFASVVRTVADAMTGLPTIIAGLFVYAAWVKPRGTAGASGFAAAMALAVVMLPTVVRTAEEVLRIVPGDLRSAALALGSPEWRVTLRVVLPTARTGLVTAGILGVARAVGETAPVLLTAFGSSRINLDPLHGPQANLPVEIYTLVRLPSAADHRAAWGGALLLVLMILTLFTLARTLGTGGGTRRRRPRARR